jgi:hypothetical protein
VKTEFLSHGERTALLARIAFELTICARDTYEAGTDNVSNAKDLRAYNELLHRVTAAVAEHVSGTDSFSLESVLEIIRAFGSKHNRVKEIEFALARALQQSKSRVTPD